MQFNTGAGLFKTFRIFLLSNSNETVGRIYLLPTAHMSQAERDRTSVGEINASKLEEELASVT